MKNTKERGITLIALIITVIIMIILAGIGLNYAFGEFGIIKRTEDAAKLYQNAADNEIGILNKIEQEYDRIIDKEKKFTIYVIDDKTKQGLSCRIEIYNNKECTGTPLQVIEVIDGTYTTKDNLLPAETYYVKVSNTPAGYEDIGTIEYKILGNDNEEWVIKYNSGADLPAWNALTWTVTSQSPTNWEQLTGVKVTITPEERIKKVDFKMYYIGNIEIVSGKATLEYLEPYKTIIGTIESDSQYKRVTEELANYMKTNGITEQYSESAEASNNLVQNNVPKGIYLIVADKADLVADENYYVEESAEIVNIGIASSQSGTYTGANEIYLTYRGRRTLEKENSVQVKIEWVDSGHESERPANINVYLTSNNEVFDTVELNKENNWSYNWEELSKEDEWGIDVGNINNYTCSIEKLNNQYTLVLTYKESDVPPPPIG